MHLLIKTIFIVGIAFFITVSAKSSVSQGMEIFVFVGIIVFLFLLLNKRRLSPTKAEDQLKLVKSADFKQKKLMNGFEYRTYKIIKEWVGTRGLLFSQVNMGEILATDNFLAFRSINSKRLDFLIITHEGLPWLAIECQGNGHYRGNAEVRDKVKAAALESANVPLLEVFESQNKQDIIKSLNEVR